MGERRTPECDQKRQRGRNGETKTGRQEKTEIAHFDLHKELLSLICL